MDYHSHIPLPSYPFSDQAERELQAQYLSQVPYREGANKFLI